MIKEIDPRVKLFYSLIILVWGIVSANWVLLGILLIIQIVVTLFAYIAKNSFLFFWSLKYYFILLIGINSLFFWNRMPMIFYVVLILKIINLVLISLFLLQTTSPERLIQAFDRLGLPSDLAWSLGSSVRLLDDMKREASLIIDAQTMRGVNYKIKNPLKQAKNMLNILSPLLTQSFVRSTQMAHALKTRRWKNAKDRTSVTPLNWSRKDSLVFIILIIVGVIFPVAFYFNMIEPIK